MTEAQALAMAVGQKLRGLQPGAHTIQLPAPVINVEVRAPDVNVPAAQVTVNVDLEPLREVFERLLAALDRREDAPTVVVEAPRSPPITVEAPDVTIVSPRAPKRRIKITHSDGSTSVVEEQ